jgi:hypothetical protein
MVEHRGFLLAYLATGRIAMKRAPHALAPEEKAWIPAFAGMTWRHDSVMACAGAPSTPWRWKKRRG